MKRILAYSFVAIFALGLILGNLMTLAAMQWTQHIRNTARLKTVGVGIYQDADFTILVTLIDWGTLEPGETKNVSVYILNTSNVPITLNMTTENWIPANASNYMVMSWTYDGSVIAVGGYVHVALILSVKSTISGITNFSFDIVVRGTG